eukprot:6853380-Prymnesium_polylepis.2
MLRFFCRSLLAAAASLAAFSAAPILSSATFSAAAILSSAACFDVLRSLRKHCSCASTACSAVACACAACVCATACAITDRAASSRASAASRCAAAACAKADCKAACARSRTCACSCAACSRACAASLSSSRSAAASCSRACAASLSSSRSAAASDVTSSSCARSVLVIGIGLLAAVVDDVDERALLRGEARHRRGQDRPRLRVAQHLGRAGVPRIGWRPAVAHDAHRAGVGRVGLPLLLDDEYDLVEDLKPFLLLHRLRPALGLGDHGDILIGVEAEHIQQRVGDAPFLRRRAFVPFIVVVRAREEVDLLRLFCCSDQAQLLKIKGRLRLFLHLLERLLRLRDSGRNRRFVHRQRLVLQCRLQAGDRTVRVLKSRVEEGKRLLRAHRLRLR